VTLVQPALIIVKASVVPVFSKIINDLALTKDGRVPAACNFAGCQPAKLHAAGTRPSLALTNQGPVVYKFFDLDRVCFGLHLWFTLV